MAKNKFKHLTLDDRCDIQLGLERGDSFTEIGTFLHKDRTTIAKEVWKHRQVKESPNKLKTYCEKLNNPPYVCNGCALRQGCRKKQYWYNALSAQGEYKADLSERRSNLHISHDEIEAINALITPLMMKQHHSVNHVFLAHPETLTMSKSTLYRYIDRGVFTVRNIDLPRKVKWRAPKAKKEASRASIDSAKKLNRRYDDFRTYYDDHPQASVVEMDTVIGTQGGKGGKCLLTLHFRRYHFMLIYLLPYKQSKYVTEVFCHLKDVLGDEEFARLFEIILTDNGTEFGDPDSIELSLRTGERLAKVFYCDPNASWQKGSIEKNHEYIRSVMPKGTSFAGLTQEKCYLLASHINSVPRESLNGQSPYEAALRFVGCANMDSLQIRKIDNNEIDLSPRLIRDKQN
ncbi:MAG: IS30 family transposase [Clostridia bacterium]|nr:IS30 family transposase [Clostridia bacterium]